MSFQKYRKLLEDAKSILFKPVMADSKRVNYLLKPDNPQEYLARDDDGVNSLAKIVHNRFENKF